MKYSENRKITACVIHDRDSLQRKNLWALLCVVLFCVFYFYNIVQCGEKVFFSFLESFILKIGSLFDSQRNRQTESLILIITSL